MLGSVEDPQGIEFRKDGIVGGRVEDSIQIEEGDHREVTLVEALLNIVFYLQ